MIKLTDSYGISVDDYNFISGKIYTGKDGKTVLIRTRYFSTLPRAIEDIAKRVCMGRLQDKDLDLLEAAQVIQNTYKEFSEKISDLEKRLSFNAEETSNE